MYICICVFLDFLITFLCNSGKGRVYATPPHVAAINLNSQLCNSTVNFVLQYKRVLSANHDAFSAQS